MDTWVRFPVPGLCGAFVGSLPYYFEVSLGPTEKAERIMNHNQGRNSERSAFISRALLRETSVPVLGITAPPVGISSELVNPNPKPCCIRGIRIVMFLNMRGITSATIRQTVPSLRHRYQSVQSEINKATRYFSKQLFQFG